MATGDNVDIPRDVFLACPMINFKLRQAWKCNACEHFRGLAQRMTQPGVRMPFEAEFAGRCAYPQDKQLIRVELESAILVAPAGSVPL